MPHMSLQSLHLFGHGVEVFSIILLPRGLHSPKSGTGEVVINDHSLGVHLLITVFDGIVTALQLCDSRVPF